MPFCMGGYCAMVTGMAETTGFGSAKTAVADIPMLFCSLAHSYLPSEPNFSLRSRGSKY